MSKVFIVQETDRDLSAAKQFGEFNVILSYKDLEKGTQHILEKIERHLNNKITSDDYILCVGDPIAIGLTMMVTFENTNSINVLRWDKRTMNYKTDKIIV
jgi:hypothetical protein